MSSASISLLTTFILLIISAFLGGLIAKKLKLPTLIGYIIAGIIIGNILNSFKDNQILEMVADAGVTLLLFTLGIEFSFQRLKKIYRQLFLLGVV
jgi:monovalent cation:H+ antiporter-2, CPA2 family